MDRHPPASARREVIFFSLTEKGSRKAPFFLISYFSGIANGSDKILILLENNDIF
jgi:hypothetical protein